MQEPQKMELTSMDVAEEKRAELKRCLGEAFPEAFAEGAIDFDQLKRVLGKWVEPSKVRIPTEVGRPFRSMWATDSEGRGPGIPRKRSCHSDIVGHLGLCEGGAG